MTTLALRKNIQHCKSGSELLIATPMTVFFFFLFCSSHHCNFLLPLLFFFLHPTKISKRQVQEMREKGEGSYFSRIVFKG
jgi:hypothetical protein